MGTLLNAAARASWDVVVVGAGPSGAAAALACARAGASVLLVDRARFPRWKVCGACLGRGALSLLDALGVSADVRALGGVPLTSLVLRTDGRDARAARVRLDGSLALSRASLDRAIVHAAEREGAVVRDGARAELLGRSGDACVVRIARDGGHEEVRAGVVIDATGLAKGLTTRDDPVTRPAPGARVGLGAELDDPSYPVAPGEVHMAVGPRGYVGVVRVEDGALNVAAAVDADALRRAGPDGPLHVVDAILVAAGLPPLDVPPRHGWRGTPPLTRSAADVGEERLFRVGDAAGYLEPFTGEGIGWALGDGLAAAAAARRALDGSLAPALAEWRAYRHGRRRSAERLCRAVAGALRRPWLVRAAVGSLRAVPRLGDPFVARAGRVPLGPARVVR